MTAQASKPVPPTFALFPHAFDKPRNNPATFITTDSPCSCCRQCRGWLYDGVFFGPDACDDWRICPWCIADGNADRAGISFNQIDPKARSQTVDEEIAHVERRTPAFFTWQDLYWPTCCPRACVFFGTFSGASVRGEVEQAIRRQLDRDCDGDADLAAHWMWLLKAEDTNDPAAYLFKCSACDGMHARWDVS